MRFVVFDFVFFVGFFYRSVLVHARLFHASCCRVRFSLSFWFVCFIGFLFIEACCPSSPFSQLLQDKIMEDLSSFILFCLFHWVFCLSNRDFQHLRCFFLLLLFFIPPPQGSETGGCARCHLAEAGGARIYRSLSGTSFPSVVDTDTCSICLSKLAERW